MIVLGYGGVERLMVKVPDRERVDLARAVFTLHEQGFSLEEIGRLLTLTASNVVNLVGYGRRLAAGQGEPMYWDRDGSGSLY